MTIDREFKPNLEWLNGRTRDSRTERGFDARARLQSKDGICRYLGHISHSTYDSWQQKGIVPGPVAGTNRYDIRQHDRLLDARAGEYAPKPASLSPVEAWEAEYARSS